MPIENIKQYNILLITGIANSTQLIKEIYKYTDKVKHINFPDHHAFSTDDINKIGEEYNKFGENTIILTTEKDYVRLMGFEYLEDKLFYWPINIEIDKKEEFNEIILNYVRKN